MIPKLFIFTLILTLSHADLESFAMPKYNSTALTRVMIDYMNHLMPFSPLVNIFQVSYPNNTERHLQMINEILWHTNRNNVVHRVIVRVEIVFEWMQRNLPIRKRFNNFLLMDFCPSFDKFFKQMNSRKWEYLGYFVIGITIHSDDIYMCMTKIFEAFWSKHIINVVIMFTPHGNNEVILYTFYPFSSFYCEHTVPVQLNHYRGNKYLNPINYFPKKLLNFHGCRIKVVTFNNPPFMMYKKDKNGAVAVDGIDGTLLRVLSQQLNFNVDIYIAPDMWGLIHENGTVTGAMQMVKQNKMNLTLGFFVSLPSRDEIMKSSFAYFTTNLIWIIPPGRPQSAIRKLLNPLKYITWSIFTASLIFGYFVIAFLKTRSIEIQNFVFGRGNRSPEMNFMSVIFGNSLQRIPTRNFARFLFFTFTIYCFLLRSAYQGGLVKFMQMDTREPKLMTTNELLEHNYKLYMVPASIAYIEEMPKLKEHIVTVSPEELNEGLRKINNEPINKGAYLSTLSHLAYRNKVAFPNYLNWATEPILTLNVVMYMQQDACFKNVFDRILEKLSCSGLINKWALAWIEQKYLKEPQIDHVQVLNLKQLEGAFQLLVGGLTLAAIVFCAEISMSGFKKLKKFFSGN